MNGTWRLASDERNGMNSRLTGAVLTETNHRPLSVCSSGCRCLCLIAVILLSSRGWFQHRGREDREELREGRRDAERPWFLRLSRRVASLAGAGSLQRLEPIKHRIHSGDDESRQHTMASRHKHTSHECHWLFFPFTVLFLYYVIK